VPAYESNLCEFSIDRRKRMQTNMTMGVVANGKFLGGGFLVAPRANVSDGFLDIVVLKDSGSLKMLDELVNIKTGNYSNDDNILYAQARRITIKSKERDVTVTIDGEPVGILPVTFQVIPEALNVVM
jgi:diacylglycerol kinase family enzyme